MKKTSFPRETVEFLPVEVTLDGVVVTDAVAFCVTVDGERPTVFTAATVIDTKTGVMVDGMDPGVYRVWAQVTDSPEIPVIDCDTFAVT